MCDGEVRWCSKVPFSDLKNDLISSSLRVFVFYVCVRACVAMSFPRNMANTSRKHCLASIVATHLQERERERAGERDKSHL